MHATLATPPGWLFCASRPLIYPLPTTYRWDGPYTNAFTILWAGGYKGDWVVVVDSLS